jgi:hypothetical protein
MVIDQPRQYQTTQTTSNSFSSTAEAAAHAIFGRSAGWSKLLGNRHVHVSHCTMTVIARSNTIKKTLKTVAPVMKKTNRNMGARLMTA